VITKKDISVVIQGPLDLLSIQNLDVYEDFGEIIISSWVDSDLEKLSKLPKKPVNIVISDYPEKLKDTYNYGNFYLQCLSTLNGIKKSSFDYCLKLRSDELYPDINALVEKLVKNPDKIINTNIHFLKNSVSTFHCSDHVVLGEAEKLLAAFTLCKTLCEEPEKFQFKVKGDYLVSPENLELHAERLLGYMFCKHKISTENLDGEINIRDLMKSVFEVVPLSDLKDFTFSCNSSRANKNAPYHKYVKNDWFTGGLDICSHIQEL